MLAWLEQFLVRYPELALFLGQPYSYWTKVQYTGLLALC